jgi:hypothetical protein
MTISGLFYNLDAELADLGPLTQIVFEPAYSHQGRSG